MTCDGYEQYTENNQLIGFITTSDNEFILKICSIKEF